MRHFILLALLLGLFGCTRAQHNHPNSNSGEDPIRREQQLDKEKNEAKDRLEPSRKYKSPRQSDAKGNSNTQLNSNQTENLSPSPTRAEGKKLENVKNNNGIEADDDVNVREQETAIYAFAEEMPFLITEKDDTTLAFFERKKIGDQAVMSFIYAHFQAPQNAQSGKLNATFVVTRMGTMEDVQCTDCPTPGMCAELQRVLVLMREKYPRWRPGRQGGEFVNVRVAFPVRLTLK